MLKRKPFVFWTICFVLLSLSLFIKAYTPVYVENLYENSSFEILNFLSGSKETRSLEYYLGMVEENMLGPTFILLSGIVLLMIALTYLKNANGIVFGSVVLLYLLVTKFEVLFFPPYGDTASGPMMEGWWLYKHNFDYLGLYQQPSFPAGGPKAYLFSIYPTYIALLMKLIPNAQWFLVINHFFVFVYGSITVVYFRKLVGRIFDKETSLLVSILFLSMPLFQSQVEAINMEMPQVMFAVMAVYFLSVKNIFMAMVLSIISATVKGTGIIICGAVFIVGIFLFFFDKEQQFRWKTLLWAFIALGFVVFEMYLSFYVLYEDAKVGMVGMFLGWKELRRLPITYLSLVCLLIFIGQFIISKIKKRRETSLVEYLRTHYVIFITLVCIISYYGLYVHSEGQQYRYRLLLTPFGILCLFYFFQHLVKHAKFIKWSLVGMTLFSFICSYGLIFPPHPISTHSALERSLEYRNDLKVHMKLVKQVQERFKRWTIAAPITIAHALAFKELGFIQEDLDVMIYDWPCKYGQMKSFNGLKNIEILKTMWIGFDTHIPKHMSFLDGYPIGPYDKVVDEVVYGNRKAYLFIGGAMVEKRRIALVELAKRLYEKGILKLNAN